MVDNCIHASPDWLRNFRGKCLVCCFAEVYIVSRSQYPGNNSTDFGAERWKMVALLCK